MRSIPLLIHADRLEITDYWSKVIRQAVTDAGGPIRGEIVPYTPESARMRRYVFGSLIKLIIFLDDGDYRDPKINDYYFEFLKTEFSPEVIKINGKIRTFGKSTKGSKALKGFAEKCLDFLHDQYGISRDNKALLPEEYKKFMSEIYSFGNDYEDWIAYILAMKWISKDKFI